MITAIIVTSTVTVYLGIAAIRMEAEIARLRKEQDR